MSYYEGESGHPRREDIPLTPENEELRQQLVEGLETTLLSAGTALTAEVTDTSARSELPNERHLARIAFIKFRGLGESVAPFQVAVELDAHLLDADVAEQSPEEIALLGYAWPDGVRATLIDREYSKIRSWTSRFQPNAGNVFVFTYNESDFVVTEMPDDDALGQAYGLSRDLNSDASIAEGGQDGLAAFRMMSVMLGEGEVDTETTETFLGAIEGSYTLRLIPTDSAAATNSREYVDVLLREAVRTPKLRDMLAWQQYWHGLGQARG